MSSILYFVKKLHTHTGRSLYINLLGMVIVSLLEGVAILFLVPMITMSGMVSLDMTGTRLEEALSWLAHIPGIWGLPFILVIYMLLAVGQQVLQRRITIRNSEIQHNFSRQLRRETYRELLYADWRFFLRKRRSDLVHLMTSEIATASTGAHSFLQFVASLIFTAIQVGIALWLSPHITLFVLACGVLLVWLSRTHVRRSMTLGSRNFESGKQYLAGITDQINGIKDMKSNSMEESRLEWFGDVTLRMQQEQLEYTRLSTKSQLYYKIASVGLIVGCILVASQWFHAQAGELLLIIVIFSRLWPRVAGIQASLEQMASRIPSYEAVIAMQRECGEAREFVLEPDQTVEPLRLEQGIKLDHVYFRYDGNQTHYALHDIEAFLPASQMTAVIGQSGAGKSTLIDVIMGLNRPEKGQVLIDGAPLVSHQLASLRQSISYVPQEPFLFHTTIRDNLLLAAPSADESSMWEALEFASAAHFVRNLPDGLDTMIGDRGIRLSGGERQRLVLARAILRRPRILVLDEATSALDLENEAHIQRALERLRGRMTIIVIAHRLSTIRHADQVIVMDQGRIMRTGKPDQLDLDFGEGRHSYVTSAAAVK